MTKQSIAKTKFESNPFFVASNGITLLAQSARNIFILFIIIAIIDIFTKEPKVDDKSMDATVTALGSWTITEWVIGIGSIFFIVFAIVLIMSLLSGVSSYTSARLARGHSVNLNEAFRVAFENVWAYLWLQIIILFKVLGWTLLLIVPGIIMSVRYSLAGVAFYDEKKHLRGNAAIQESVRMTKNGWLTTYASNALFSFMTLGTMSMVVSTAVNAILYRQFEQVGVKKPAAHWLSWLTLFLPLLALLILCTLVVVGAIVVNVLGIS